jgi:hypothetical protein
MKAPFLVPTRTRTVLIDNSPLDIQAESRLRSAMPKAPHLSEGLFPIPNKFATSETAASEASTCGSDQFATEL